MEKTDTTHVHNLNITNEVDLLKEKLQKELDRCLEGYTQAVNNAKAYENEATRLRTVMLALDGKVLPQKDDEVHGARRKMRILYPSVSKRVLNCLKAPNTDPLTCNAIAGLIWKSMTVSEQQQYDPASLLKTVSAACCGLVKKGKAICNYNADNRACYLYKC